MERAHAKLLRSTIYHLPSSIYSIYSDHVNLLGMRDFNRDHVAHKPYTLKDRGGGYCGNMLGTFVEHWPSIFFYLLESIQFATPESFPVFSSLTRVRGELLACKRPWQRSKHVLAVCGHHGARLTFNVCRSTCQIDFFVLAWMIH